MKKLLLILALGIFFMSSAAFADTAKPVSNWTPATTGYGLKIFWEDINQFVRGVFFQKGEFDYLKYRIAERGKEMNKLNQQGIIDPSYFQKDIAGIEKYSDQITVLLNKQQENQRLENAKAADIFGNVQTLDDWNNLIIKKMDVLRAQINDAKTAGDQGRIASLLAELKDIKKNFDEANVTNGNFEIYVKFNVEQVETLLATNDRIDYLSNRAEEYKNYLQDLSVNPNQNQSSYAEAVKKLDGFISNLKDVKNSVNPDNQKVQDLFGQLKAEFDNIDQNNQRQALSDQSKNALPEEKVNQPAAPQAQPQSPAQPQEQGNPQPTANQPEPQPQPAPQPKKPVLKQIPSEPVNTNPLILHYYKEIKGAVGKKIPVTALSTYAGSGGLPPYHFQLGSGVGFPPMGIILDPSGQLTGTPTVVGTYNFSVCVVDTAGTSACGDIQMVVVPALELNFTCEDLNLENRCLLYSGTASVNGAGEIAVQSYDDGEINCASWPSHVNPLYPGGTADPLVCYRGADDPPTTAWTLRMRTALNGVVQYIWLTDDSGANMVKKEGL